MAAGDLVIFQSAAVNHAQSLKRLITQAKELRAFWDKIALPGAETATAPLSNTDLANYATLCNVLQDLMDNVAVTAGDRRAILERVATLPVTRPT